MATFKKPVLKGFHNATISRNLIGMGISVFLVGVTTHFTFKRPRKQVFAEFYKNYDAEAAADRMREAGVFQSTPPDPKAKKKK